MRTLTAALLLLLPLAAMAQELMVESEPLVERDDALALQAQLREAGAEVRLVRRFHQGQGWRFVVVVEQLDDLEQASSLASLSESLSVVGAPLPPPPPVTDTPPPVAEEPPRLMTADAVLHAAIRAHGGREGGNVVLSQASTVRFTYTRSMPEEGGLLRVHNVFQRSGAAMRLDVRIEEGEGADSSTILTADRQGWISTDSSNMSRDGDRTLQILERFSPESILALPLGLPLDVETATAWRSLETTERREEDGTEVWLLERTEDDDLDGLIEATFSVQDRRLRRVTWRAEQGEISFHYSNYQTLDRDLVIPLQASITRGGDLLEEVTIAELTLDPVLDESLFTAPDSE